MHRNIRDVLMNQGLGACCEFANLEKQINPSRKVLDLHSEDLGGLVGDAGVSHFLVPLLRFAAYNRIAGAPPRQRISTLRAVHRHESTEADLLPPLYPAADLPIRAADGVPKMRMMPGSFSLK
jgi:hypothetical protein